ncbi:darcynin family protein [Saccharospirillum sp. HFRX-1]|uniref:darcynin family protein n=1 Tax=unclassified Saccharospirillum TaxID=2633430 RepID=UPI00371C2395
MSTLTTAEPMFTVFVLLRALPAWLGLSREQRNDIAESSLSTAIEGRAVTLQHFDAEAFSSYCSDISVFETRSLLDFYCVMERLRDSPLFSVPYFELVQILPALQDGFRYYEQLAGGALSV